MKLFGYSNKDYDEVHPLELSNVTIAANPQELRRIAKFFNQAASEIEEDETGFEHEHLMDNQDGFDPDADIIIYNSALMKD